jgi:hypothetical protein
LLAMGLPGSTTLLQVDDQVAGGTIKHFFSFPPPGINDAGQVAFNPLIFFQDPTCDDPLMRTFAGGAEVIVTGGADSCEFVQLGGAPLAINGIGQIAYVPEVDDRVLGLVDTVAVDSSKIWDARDPAFPPNLQVTDVALDDVGEAAFRVANSIEAGIYTGSDPVSGKVLARGDSLCGSTVIGVDFHRYGIDPLGRLALGVALADGRQLVVRAEEVLGDGGACITAPEPDALAVAGAVIAALVGVAGAARGRTSPFRPRTPAERPPALR